MPLTTKIMAIPVAEFSREGYKIYLSLAENEITVFCELVLWGGVKKWRNLTFKIIRIFLIFFLLENTKLGTHFLLVTFFDNINF